LLVVIAIIAILAAILFPVFARARANARKASCLSNEKQVGLGILQYTQDYDETYPTGMTEAFDSEGATRRGMGWAGQISPYVKSAQIFVCPDDQTPSACSYGFNSNLHRVTASAGQDVGSLNFTTGSLASVNSPAKTIMLFEVTGARTDVTKPYDAASGTGDQYSASGHGTSSNEMSPSFPAVTGAPVVVWYDTGVLDNGAWGNSARFDPVPSGVADGSGYTPSVSGKGRHLEGSNFLFADGHAKWLKPSAVSAGRNALAEVANQTQTGPRAEGSGGPVSGAAHAGTFSKM
jgi:prepilin-type processing-associated H-X9-DG protein